MSCWGRARVPASALQPCCVHCSLPSQSLHCLCLTSLLGPYLEWSVTFIWAQTAHLAYPYLPSSLFTTLLIVYSILDWGLNKQILIYFYFFAGLSCSLLGNCSQMVARNGASKVASFAGPGSDSWKARKQDSFSVFLHVISGLPLSMDLLSQWFIHVVSGFRACQVSATKSTILKAANPLGFRPDLVQHHFCHTSLMHVSHGVSPIHWRRDLNTRRHGSCRDHLWRLVAILFRDH